MLWQEWWQNPEEVDLVQFMGKDNVPFHTIIFPASQIGTRERWTQMKNISVTEYLNYEGEKFSKSNGVGVFGDNARETGIPVEVSTPCLCLRIPTAFFAVKFGFYAHTVGQIYWEHVSPQK